MMKNEKMKQREKSAIREERKIMRNSRRQMRPRDGKGGKTKEEEKEGKNIEVMRGRKGKGFTCLVPSHTCPVIN